MSHTVAVHFAQKRYPCKVMIFEWIFLRYIKQNKYLKQAWEKLLQRKNPVYRLNNIIATFEVECFFNTKLSKRYDGNSTDKMKCVPFLGSQYYRVFR